MRILAVSGSLRAQSSNTQVLLAAAKLAPSGVEVVLFDGLGELPHFNPDHEADPPPSVRRWSDALKASAGVLICTPEYAHGVPGVLKNGLDWLVGSGEFVERPVAVVNASPLSTYAHTSILETLAVMSAHPLGSVLPFKPVKLDAAGIAADPKLSAALRATLDALCSEARAGPVPA
jgi:chromate reductase, NAD(P)H dehydrogenase (quinone)